MSGAPDDLAATPDERVRRPRRHEEAMSRDFEAEIVGACRVCAGQVVRVTRFVYRGGPMHRIVGPGSKNQMSRDVKIACSECGVMYSKPPPVQEPKP